MKTKELTGDTERWAEFHVIININVISDCCINISTLQNSVRDIKQVGAKDNYLFIFATENQEAVNDNHVDVCTVVCIDVINMPSVDVKLVFLAEIIISNEIDMKALTNAWRLDGRHKLDGSMRLNAKVEEYRWEQ